MRLQWYTVSFLVIMMQSASALANDVIWKEEPQNTTSVKGGNVTLRCSFDGIIKDSPLPRWSKGISRVSYGVNVEVAKQGLCHVVGNHAIGEYNLLLTNVSAESAGEWKCSHVLASPQTKSAYLDVIESRPLKSSGDDGLVHGVIVGVVCCVVILIAICVIVACRKRNNVNFPCRRYKEVHKDIVI